MTARVALFPAMAFAEALDWYVPSADLVARVEPGTQVKLRGVLLEEDGGARLESARPLWIELKSCSPPTFEGVIVTTPFDVDGYRKGDALTFTSDRICDVMLAGGRRATAAECRAAALANEFLERLMNLEEVLRSLTDEQWARPCRGEGWPVGYVAHHIGQGIVRPRGWIEQVLVGEEPFEFDWDVTHELNRRRSARLGLPPRNDTLRFIEVSAQHFGALIRSLSDEQLDRVGFAHGPARRDVAWVVRLVMRHMDEHFAGILDAIA